MPKQKNINFKRRLVVAGLSALTLAVLVPAASTYAWGPDRPTYKMKTPPDHPTFNSITDNNIIGDERDFVRVTEVGGNGKYVNELKITPGKTYEVYIFYHNNAASNLNASGKGLADKVKVRSTFPSKINSSSKGTINATISAANTTPASVWDEAYLTTDSKQDVELHYVNATAKIKNQGKLNNTILSTELFTTGDYIGYNNLSGTVPGCSEFSGHIVYRIRAEQAGSSVDKTASTNGKDFFKDVTAKPGDTITYKITFKNSGSKDLTNVTFRDQLPSGVTLVPGSVTLTDTGTKKTRTLVDNIVSNGVNTGTFGEGVTGYITYKVKVSNDIVKNGSCGTNTFKNTVTSTTDQTGRQNSSANIKVDKTCDKPDPCRNEDGSVKSECCDQEQYKDEPACKPDEEDPCKNEDGSIKNECCDQPEYKDLPQCKEEPEPTPELPNTGPGEIALAVVAAVCVITGVSYWYRSQKEVAEVQKGIKGNGHHDK